MIDTPIFKSVVAEVGPPPMPQVRVWHIAKALGVESKDVMRWLDPRMAKSASSNIGTFFADDAVCRMTDYGTRLVFTEGARPDIFLAYPGDVHNNVLRRFMLCDGSLNNPADKRGKRTTWVVLRDLGMKVGPAPAGEIHARYYEAVNVVSGEVKQVPAHHMTCLL